MRVAIVHDWLLGMRGGERCLEVLCERFPDAHVYTAFYAPRNVVPTIRNRRVFVSVLQRLPRVSSYYRWLLPLYPLAAWSLGRKLAKQHQSQPYDLMISVSHCLAKNVTPPKGVPHVCYCLTPVRYIWDHFETYFSGKGIEPIATLVAKPFRIWDRRGAKSVSRFLGISQYIANRIQRVYGRTASVVYPPVRTNWIQPCADGTKGEGFLCVNALVPYKNVDLVVNAFAGLPYPLTVIGSGPERGRLLEMTAQLGAEHITFIERVSDAELAEAYRNTKALVFAAEEDFGMVPVEVQAAGRAVICYGRGGSLETVRDSGEGKTGIYFTELTEDSLRDAVRHFIHRQEEFTVDNCCTNARSFSEERFLSDFDSALEEIGLGSPTVNSLGENDSSLSAPKRVGESY